jgi:membrane complex biogenesis BtpA family protein
MAPELESPSSAADAAKTRVPSLVGVIHLAPLPGSPRFGGSLSAVIASAIDDAARLASAGFEAAMVENFGDAPFYPGSAPAVTVAAMAACALAVRQAEPRLSLGVNVLRNDAEAALAVAIASGASMIRVNVHMGARVTDQGIVEGLAHQTLRLRRELGAESIALLADVDVKHSAPLGPRRPIGEEAHELEGRGLADAVLVTGGGTGRPAARGDLDDVLRAVKVPVLVASGVEPSALDAIAGAHGVVVGSCLRKSGRAGDPVDAELARRFADAFRARRA